MQPLPMTPKAMEMAKEVANNVRAVKAVGLEKGESINVKMINEGVWMKVLNFTEDSVTVRPEIPLLFIVKGVPVYIHKIVHGDLVLRRLTKKQADEITSKMKGMSPA